MIDPPKAHLELADADLLAELEQSTPEAVKGARLHTRVTIRTRVYVQPGNMSERRALKVQGVTGDISAGGCQLLLPLPINVGDIYFITFDKEALGITPAYARCMRCRLVREDAFEAGFAFFTPIDLNLATKSEPSKSAPLV